MSAQLQLVVDRVHRKHLQCEAVAGHAARRALRRDIERQGFNPHESQTILGTKPAQKINLPGGVALLLKPDLLPMALILSADRDSLANGEVNLIDLLLQLRDLV